MPARSPRSRPPPRPPMPPTLPEIERAIAGAHLRRGDLVAAARHLDAALDGRVDPAFVARVLVDRSVVLPARRRARGAPTRPRSAPSTLRVGADDAGGDRGGASVARSHRAGVGRCRRPLAIASRQAVAAADARRPDRADRGPDRPGPGRGGGRRRRGGPAAWRDARSSSAGRSATGTSRGRSRTTSPTCSTPPAATTTRWPTCDARSRRSRRSVATRPSLTPGSGCCRRPSRGPGAPTDPNGWPGAKREVAARCRSRSRPARRSPASSVHRAADRAAPLPSSSNAATASINQSGGGGGASMSNGRKSATQLSPRVRARARRRSRRPPGRRCALSNVSAGDARRDGPRASRRRRSCRPSGPSAPGQLERRRSGRPRRSASSRAASTASRSAAVANRTGRPAWSRVSRPASSGEQQRVLPGHEVRHRSA